MEELSYCIERGMREYLLESHWKVMIDDLQQGLQCCGFKSYEDWFKTIWIPIQSVRTDLDPMNSPVKEDGSLLVPIVPHSCCNPEVRIPCLHDTLQQNDTISQWSSAGGAASPFRDSIYIEGCHNGLLKGMMGALSSFNFLAALIIMIQVGVIIIAKYLQDFTSNRPVNTKLDVVESEKQPLI
uniref:Uncharacterized protein n=2 Tax=Rhodnius prolixus TaxID=13249 RepID=T1HLU6_RHOPR